MANLDLAQIENLLSSGKTQEVIDLLPQSYPDQYGEETKKILEVANLAAQYGRTDVLAHFMEQYKSNPSGPFSFQDAAVHAIRARQKDVLAFLTPKWSSRDSLAGQFLTDAARFSQDIDLLRFCLTLTNQFWPNEALVMASRNDAMDVVEIALAKGADPKKDRYKALSAALVHGCPQAVAKFWPLLEQEPDPGVQQRIGLIMTAACVASKDPLGYLERALKIAGPEIDRFIANPDMHRHTFRFDGPSSPELPGDELAAFLSHRLLTSALGQDDHQISSQRRSSTPKAM